MGRTGPRVGAVEPLTPDRLLADAMLHPGQPVIISDWQAETRLRLPLALREAGVASSVATVISIGPTVFSAPTVVNREPFQTKTSCSSRQPSVSLHVPSLAGRALLSRALIE